MVLHGIAPNLLFCDPLQALLAVPFLEVPPLEAISYGGMPKRGGRWEGDTNIGTFFTLQQGMH